MEKRLKWLGIRAAGVAVIAAVFWFLSPSYDVLEPRLKITVTTPDGQPIQGAHIFFLDHLEDEVWSFGSDQSMRDGTVPHFKERSGYAESDAAGKATLNGRFDHYRYLWGTKINQGGLLWVEKNGHHTVQLRFHGPERKQQILDGEIKLSVQLKKKAA